MEKKVSARIAEKGVQNNTNIVAGRSGVAGSCWCQCKLFLIICSIC